MKVRSSWMTLAALIVMITSLAAIRVIPEMTFRGSRLVCGRAVRLHPAEGIVTAVCGGVSRQAAPLDKTSLRRKAMRTFCEWAAPATGKRLRPSRQRRVIVAAANGRSLVSATD